MFLKFIITNTIIYNFIVITQQTYLYIKMKKIIFMLTLAAFVLQSAAQASPSVTKDWSPYKSSKSKKVKRKKSGSTKVGRHTGAKRSWKASI